MLTGVHDFAERYMSLAVSKLAESPVVRSFKAVLIAVAAALVLQVIILAYVAYRLSSGHARAPF